VEIQREEFRLPDHVSSDRQEEWERLVSITHVDMSVKLSDYLDGRAFQGQIRRQWINDFALVDCVCDPCSGTRTRSRIEASDADYVAILFNLGGREVVSQGDLEKEMCCGDAIVWDTNNAIRFQIREPLTKRSLLIPRAALAEVGGRTWQLAGTAVDGSSAEVRLLAGYLDLLSNSLESMSRAAISAARNATLELFVGAVRHQVSVVASDSAAPALRAHIEDWINKHLFDGDISPATIAAAHGVSVRTVHRVFESDGESLIRYVRARRLARARQELAAQPSLAIASIARQLGFTDSSHFTRAFKARYGVSPGEYRADARTQLGLAL
jgi:AraC-like DNA-binding protein